MTKNFILHFFLFLFTAILFNSLFSAKVYTAGEFATAYDVYYTFSEDGTAEVTQKIVLTNLTDNLYASEYAITIGDSRITNVLGSDDFGVLKPDVTQGRNETTIHLLFNKQIVGIGKKNNFSLNYTVPGAAQHLGRIWRIIIPKVDKDTYLSSYNVYVEVPKSFGTLAYAKPKPVANLTWNLNQLAKSGIEMAFGDYGVFNFSLTYHLENPQDIPVETEIALPMDTATQKIFFQDISPKPHNISQDADGNWMARVGLNPGQSLNLLARGQAVIFIRPRDEARIRLTSEERAKYLAPQDYWEADDPHILKLAKTLRTPRAIYNYVESTLSYDYKRVSENIKRIGARNILNTPEQAICMEFTDLFIAISRAAGIPAREINGYAYTDNPQQRPLSLIADILHAWPEYYDEEKEMWIPVDPTWASTTGLDFFESLDFSHFAFVIHGLSSKYPYAAGSYKQEADVGKDVEVNFGDRLPKFLEYQPDVLLDLPEGVSVRNQIQGKIIITNSNSSAISHLPIYLGTSDGEVKPNNFYINSLPPFSRQTIFFTLVPKQSFLNLQNRTLWVQAGSKSYSKSMKILNMNNLTYLLFIPMILLVMIFIFWLGRILWIKLKRR